MFQTTNQISVVIFVTSDRTYTDTYHGWTGWSPAAHFPRDTRETREPAALKNDGVKVSWDDDISNCFWKVKKIHGFKAPTSSDI